MEELLKVEHLVKTFGKNEVLKDIDFSVQRGDVISIIGASGSGKSTLLRCINMLEDATSGNIIFGGKDVLKGEINEDKYRTQVGMVFQSFNLFANLNVLDNCMVGQTTVLKRKKEEAEKIALEYLSKVGMDQYLKAKPRQLSGGQKQRVAIARALATNPKIILCDEATSALDPATTQSILKLLKEINQKYGITIVIITHEMSVVESICSHVAIIDSGEVAEVGTVEKVFTQPESKVAKRIIYQKADNATSMFGKRCIRVVFDGKSSYEPVISNLIMECKIAVNIMFADTKDIDGKAYGHMILQLPEDRIQGDKAIYYLRSKNLVVEELEDYVV